MVDDSMEMKPQTDETLFHFEQRPYREFTVDGRGTMEDSTRFTLIPEPNTVDIDELLDRIMEYNRYTSIPWDGLPYPVDLLYDADVGSTIRVIRFSDSVALDVLPKTTQAALTDFYRILQTESKVNWTIDRSE